VVWAARLSGQLVEEAAFAVDDLERPTEGIGELQAGVDAQEGVEGGDDVLRGNGVFGGLGAEGVGSAVDLAAADAAAGQEKRIAAGPVVAARGGVDLRAAAELAH